MTRPIGLAVSHRDQLVEKLILLGLSVSSLCPPSSLGGSGEVLVPVERLCIGLVSPQNRNFPALASDALVRIPPARSDCAPGFGSVRVRVSRFGLLLRSDFFDLG